MIVIFAGPSIHGVDKAAVAFGILRAPARCGDVLKAVRDGAQAIALIDGVFESSPSVWHKEILFALAAGIRVLGAASLGALRAAECHPFGMEGIGTIFEQYRSGARTSDADVAVVHAPAELGCKPLTEALVDVEETAARLYARHCLADGERYAIETAARRLHFKERSWGAVLDTARISRTRQSRIRKDLAQFGVSQKQLDAKSLLLAVTQKAGPLAHPGNQFELSRTAFLDRLVKQV